MAGTMLDDGGTGLARGTALFLAIAAGLAIANLYAIQPALADVATTLRSTHAATDVIAGAILAGYMVGLALLVPLVDRVAPATLVSRQLAALGFALLLAAASGLLAVLVVLFALVGSLATVAAQMSALAGKHASAPNRALALGTVSTGISAGILLSRLVGGGLSDLFGYRGMLLVLALLCFSCAAVAQRTLPRQRPHQNNRRYLANVGGTLALLARSRMLRTATIAGMLWFFAFNLVWITLALTLAAAPFNLSAAEIGLYGLAGVLGLLTTRWAGQLSDRFGARTVIAGGMIIAAVGAAVLCVALGNPFATTVGLALFDAGCFAAQVANQSRVVAIEPRAAGGYSSAYLFCFYAAGAVGTVVGVPLLAVAGWGGAIGISILTVTIAGIVGSIARSPAAGALPR